MTPHQPFSGKRPLDVADYVEIARRRKNWILGPLFAGLVVSCVVAFSLKNTYVSTAVLRITPPQILEAIVPSTVTQQMTERVAQMQTQIMSRASLGELIQRPTLQLYSKELTRRPLDDVIEQMRTRDIHIGIHNLPGGARSSAAFSISFSYPDKYKAQAVVNAMITRFTEEAFRMQRGQGTITSDFLKDEAADAKTDLNRLGDQLVAFRQQNQGHLPEDLSYNVQNLNIANQRLAAATEALNRVGEDKLFMLTNLQTYKSQRAELEQLAAQTLEASGSAPRNERLTLLKAEVSSLESSLNQNSQFQTDSHPDIRTLKSLIGAKKQERDKLQALEDASLAKINTATRVVNDPAIRGRLIENQGRIDEINAALQVRENDRLLRMKQVDDLGKEIKMYQDRISSSPPQQQKYASLLRDYGMAETNYQNLQRKETAASTYDDVNRRKAGENLEVLDIASLPETPSAPNRWLFLGIGLSAGALAGIFLAALKEMNDTTLKNLKDVRAYTQLPILSSIPLLENDLRGRRERRFLYVGWSTAIVAGALAISTSLYYHYFLAS